ncbi:WD40/YVTN/BNR-like repeat-containing protein [Brevibacillus sp. SIMBA_040]|uniref:WD40/YVTN/BNR-like repeat-containing protein n=1 Tax=unclassified Brevibacillus TaxID=2684853 RepID=UPI003979D897
MKKKTIGRIFVVLGLSISILTGCQQTGDSEKQPTKQEEQSASHEDGANRQQTATTTPPSSASSPQDQAQEKVSLGKVTAVRIADFQSGWIGGDGWIAKTDDGGNRWKVQYQPKGIVKQLFALNNRQAWAVVAKSAEVQSALSLIRTEDEGQNWSVVGEMPNQDFLHFISGQEAFSGRWSTTNGGKTWTKLPVPPGTVGEPYFHDRSVGWAVTKGQDAFQVQRTIDGGKSWSVVMSKKTVSPVNGVLIRSAGPQDAWIECIGDTGMTQTSYSLFHTADGGKSWQTVIAKSTAGAGPAPGFPMDYKNGPDIGGSSPGPLYVINSKEAFMGAQCMACDKPNTIGWTLDGGKTLGKGTISLEGYGEELLAFADAKHGWWFVTDHEKPSLMYATSDGGKHWNLVHTFDPPKKQ